MPRMKIPDELLKEQVKLIRELAPEDSEKFLLDIEKQLKEEMIGDVPLLLWEGFLLGLYYARYTLIDQKNSLMRMLTGHDAGTMAFFGTYCATASIVLKAREEVKKCKGGDDA